MDDLNNNLPESSPGHGGKRPGAGRPKGSQNRLTAELKDMILGALEDAGGREYLARQAEENPSAFLALLAKVLPKNITAEVEHRHYVAEIPAPLATEDWLKARDEWLTAIAVTPGKPGKLSS